MHLVCDNYYGTHKSPAIKTWLATHPRFHMHYTPTYSSWINQVERWFAYLTDDLLRRGDHHNVQALEKDIRLGQSLERQPEAINLDENRRTDPRLTRPTFFNEFPARDSSGNSLCLRWRIMRTPFGAPRPIERTCAPVGR